MKKYIKVTEQRIAYQDWYRPNLGKTTYISHGWHFHDSKPLDNFWRISEIFQKDTYGNPISGLAVRTVDLLVPEDYQLPENYQITQ